MAPSSSWPPGCGGPDGEKCYSKKKKESELITSDAEMTPGPLGLFDGSSERAHEIAAGCASKKAEGNARRRRDSP